MKLMNHLFFQILRLTFNVLENIALSGGQQVLIFLLLHTCIQANALDKRANIQCWRNN